jgi:hypothetical protein
MSQWYKLIGRVAVPCDMHEWETWMCHHNRHVADTEIGCRRVSTVFLGLDHNRSGVGEPMLFETAIFAGTRLVEMWRCSTYEEAEAMHQIGIEVASERAKAAPADDAPPQSEPSG